MEGEGVITKRTETAGKTEALLELNFQVLYSAMTQTKGRGV